MTNYRIATVVLIICVMFLWQCVKHKAAPGEFEIKQERIQHSGLTRTFSYYVPKTLQDSSPLVIVLHKSKSSGTDMREMMEFRYEHLADQKQFVVLYPDGYGGNWNDCREAPDDTAHKKNIDDTGFISALISLFIQKHKIDPSRIYVTGMSGGGHMAFRLANEIPWEIAAMAPTLAQLPTKDNSRCADFDQSMPVFLLSGTQDPISPYGGGEISLFGLFLRQGNVLSADDTVNHFIHINGITVKPEVKEYKNKQALNQLWMEKRVWKEQAKPTVWQYIVHGGGHTLPGVRPLPSLIYGKTYNNRNIADEIIDFFWMHKNHPGKMSILK